MGRNQISKNSYYIAIFFVVMFTTLFLTLNFAPVLTRHGDSNAETADVSVEIGSVLSLTLTEEEIKLNPTPTPEGTFIHGTLSAIVDTNNKTGYTLTMNTEEEETALSQEDGVTKIDSLADEVIVTSTDQSAFTMNRWGYALAETVAESDTTFNKIPALSTPATIKTSDAPVSDDTTPVTLATKVDTSLPSGTYKNTLVFTATTNYVPGPITPPENTSALTQALADADAEFQEALDGTNYYTMQSMTSAICNAVQTPTKEEINVPEATLIDTRDNELYTVRKLADGNCWMSQNLRLQLSTSTPLTSADSDVATSWTPDLDSQTTTGTTWDDYDNATGVNVSKAGSYVDTTNTEYGGYYSWYAATASTGTYEMYTEGQEATSSICPKGWRLPNGQTSNKSFANLVKTYYPDYTYGNGNYISRNGAMLEKPFSFPLSGYYSNSNGQIYDTGSYGYWWSSTVYDAYRAYRMYVVSSAVRPQDYNDRAYGSTIRCVAR